MSPTPRVDVHQDRETLHATLCSEARQALVGQPKKLSPKWFYDARGSELFEQITRLPEYYPTRTERRILEGVAGQIPKLSSADTLIELGSGSSAKTRLLLDAFSDAGQLSRFVAFDVSEDALRQAVVAIADEYPKTSVRGLVGDFDHHLGAVPLDGTRLVLFLGGTVGNYPPEERAIFFSSLANTLIPGDSLLLGTDLVKDVNRLEAAYNDSAGVTAEFNLNVLRVLNRELGADFDPDAFEHMAFFDARHEWIEMRLRSSADQVVRLPEIGLEVGFAQAEEMRTEVSAKFRREGITTELAAAGLEVAEWWTDPAGDFALSLSFKP